MKKTPQIILLCFVILSIVSGVLTFLCLDQIHNLSVNGGEFYHQVLLLTRLFTTLLFLIGVFTYVVGRVEEINKVIGDPTILPAMIEELPTAISPLELMRKMAINNNNKLYFDETT